MQPPQTPSAGQSERSRTVASGTCNLCGERLPLEQVIEHLRVMHPDDYGDGPATWPDGEPVVIDTTLAPEDFT